MSGLKKMAHPLLHEKAPVASHQQKKVLAGMTTTLSPFERELGYAIHNRQIYPVFQPIVNGGLQLKGLEILARWQRKRANHAARRVSAADPLQLYMAVVNAFMLQEAVGGINQYQGEYYFAVNIPAAISNSEKSVRHH
ncbi:EAL domain [Cedecea neteri]|uniref:EAL domain n=1 Tax=Cedecea neteri TaxID=158822 RepID=A0A2X2T9G9_9ENTR|nr:EAL domain [Cedecea neteri]